MEKERFYKTHIRLDSHKTATAETKKVGYETKWASKWSHCWTATEELYKKLKNSRRRRGLNSHFQVLFNHLVMAQNYQLASERHWFVTYRSLTFCKCLFQAVYSFAVLLRESIDISYHLPVRMWFISVLCDENDLINKSKPFPWPPFLCFCPSMGLRWRYLWKHCAPPQSYPLPRTRDEKRKLMT